MHATDSNRKHALARTLLLGLAASLSLGAQAGEAKHMDRVSTRVAVSYADLNLTSTAGARTLYARLQSAAREACGPAPSARDLRSNTEYRACYDRALNKAVKGVDSKQLYSLHSRHSHGATVG